MIASIVCNWIFGLLVDNFKRKEKINIAKIVIAFVVFFNLIILFVFKYLNFASDSICALFGIDSFLFSGRVDD